MSDDCRSAESRAAIERALDRLIAGTFDLKADAEALSEEDAGIAERLGILADRLREASALAGELAAGRVSLAQTTIRGNPYTAPLKTLQANLAHLTWAARCVAGGDDDLRVDYMSDLSHAFNSMITHQKAQKEALARAAAVDFQTGIGNRLAFNRFAEDCWAQGRPFVLAVIDIDRLKLCNDTYGHVEGDRYIDSVSRLLKEAFAACCSVFRIGGDEFALVSQRLTLGRLSEKMTAVRDGYAMLEDERFPGERSFSFGCTTADPASGRTLDAFLAEADALMYADKARTDERDPH
ncbi:MAG: GGDEF domain-containing protein [Sutterella sp.]|nr:GGDEF domain-containing protein [Sutterella sp.]